MSQTCRKKFGVNPYSGYEFFLKLYVTPYNIKIAVFSPRRIACIYYGSEGVNLMRQCLQMLVFTYFTCDPMLAYCN